jgi:RimJ/RimL family protein N-acetyltransferase
MSDGEVIIRPAEVGDIESWRRTVGAVARESHFLAFQGTPPRRSATAFAKMVAARGLPQWFAVADGEVVGWCDVVSLSDREVWAHRGTLGIGLLAAWRGRGLGRALIEATIAAAWAYGFRRIELKARADNVRAISLYESVGFVREGYHRQAFRLGGVYYDEVAMALFPPDAGPDAGNRA